MSQLKQRLLSLVKDDLKAIETALTQNLSPHLDLVSNTARHILFSGGKRLRPLLMILAARICGYRGDDHATFSIVFEYLHAATLLHDDLVDGATLRRGKPVAHAIWGNSTTVLVGDFLLARSLSIAAQTKQLRVIQVIADITENMSLGEIHQLMRRGFWELSEEEYMEVIRRKTALLIQGACRVGAQIADAPPAEESALAVYGYNLGLAFQIIDDLLDYTADTSTLGKGVGADLKEGKVTLPLIYALKAAGAADRRRMLDILGNKDLALDEFEGLRNLLDKYGGLAYSRQQAAGYIRRAKEQLALFQPSPTREVLECVAEYALERNV
jgi:octaprenyl-diphosphate synthase